MKNKNKYNVSMFDSYVAKYHSGIVCLREWLLTSKYKEAVEAIRACDDEEQKAEMKKKLPAITPSGIFPYGRKQYDIPMPASYYLCIDIDGKDNPNVDWSEAKRVLALSLPSLYYAGLSVGGNGIFGIVRIRSADYYGDHYSALIREVEELTGLVVDKTCRNINRLRGASYDPHPFFREYVPPYEKILDVGGVRITTIVNKNETYENVKLIVEYIKLHRIDITKKYRDWRNIGFAFASEFGEGGLPWFIVVSSFYPNFNEWECVNCYSKWLSYTTSVSIGTFFWICKEHGITLKKVKERW